MIALTGGSGFIGSALIKVYGLDNVVTIGRTPVAAKHVAFDLIANSSALLAEQVRPYQPTVLIHCAAVTPWSSPQPDFSKDVAMAEQVARLCNTLKISKLIFMSGWNVYDPATPTPYTESATSLQPSTDYGKSKLAVENYLKRHLHGTSLVNIRAASVYGVGQTIAGLIPNLVGAALRGEALRLQAKKTKRDYVHIDDLTQAVKAVASMEFANQQLDLNIGSGQSVMVADVADVVQTACQQITGYMPEIKFAKALVESQPPNNQLSIARAQSFGLLQHLTPFTQGIKQYVQWRKNENIL
ncbi:MAG TPA: NAD(P)-dependent oxidoreductase [Nevskiaceae bacterium]|nr:NAD(P)-dependent oxidoreductase [Nevskiaceae bacterium]